MTNVTEEVVLLNMKSLCVKPNGWIIESIKIKVVENKNEITKIGTRLL